MKLHACTEPAFCKFGKLWNLECYENNMQSYCLCGLCNIAYIVKYYIVYYVFSILVIKIVKLQLEISVLLCTYISQLTNIPE